MTESISSCQATPLDTFSGAISKTDLNVICQRFRNLHRQRQQQIQELLLPGQQVFLDLLPLLFHLNNPLLPGFFSTETPSGISQYQPSSKTINAAEQFSAIFALHKEKLTNHLIEGIFLMGSVSSIAFTQNSDIDIWLCHASDLSAKDLDALQNKASNIERWANALNLEVHFFLIDSEKFRQGQDSPISSESSGETQHLLLLEEFYRTAIYIAGKTPAWWLVPPEEEHEYTEYIHRLKREQHITDDEIIDFGGLEVVPAEEFISATLWHLYKSINAPHKSLLKLMLIECYASEFPAPDWLCLHLKRAIYQGNCNLDDLDPYLLIYRRVARYLHNNGDHERLVLARQCLFLKVMGASGEIKNAHSRQRRKSFLKLVAENGNWPAATLKLLNIKKSWNIKRATKEHKVIMLQLIQCFRKTMGFASRHVGDEYRENSDYKLIGRKLFSTLERKPGKVEIITTRSFVHTQEKELTILEMPLPSGDVGWGLYLGKIDFTDQSHTQPIKNGWNLMEILCWLVINGLYQKKLELHFESSTLSFSRQELHLILRKLEKFLSSHLNGVTNNLEVFKEANHYSASLIFINLGLPLPEGQVDNNQINTGHTFSRGQHNKRHHKIHSIDRVSISNWGEVTINRYQGLEGLFSCLIDTINAYKGPVDHANLNISCYSLIRSKVSKLQINKVFSHLVELFTNPDTSASTRYFLPGGNTYFLLQRQNDVLSYSLLENENLIQTELANPQIDFSQIYFDTEVLKQTPIPYIYSFNRPQIIQLFALKKDTSVDLYIIDERGSLSFRRHYNTGSRQLLTAYSVFLETILTRGMLDYFLTIEYFVVTLDSKYSFTSKKVYLDPAPIWQYLNIRITGEEFNNLRTLYTIYCNEKEFSPMVYGDQVFKAASDYILHLRRSKENYPIHITDIDVPYPTLGVDNPDSIQTLHLLQYKQEIEELLNQKME